MTDSDLNKRIREIADQVTIDTSSKLGFVGNQFSFRGRGVEQKERGSRFWEVKVWYRSQTLTFPITADDESTDEALKQAITERLWKECERVGLADRLKSS